MCFVEKRSVYVPLLWVAKEHRRKVIPLILFATLAKLAKDKDITACLWNSPLFNEYILSIEQDIATLDTQKILKRFGGHFGLD